MAEDFQSSHGADFSALTRARQIAEHQWQQLVDAACTSSQVATAQLLRTEGMLQMALDLQAIELMQLVEWGRAGGKRLQAAIPNVLWPESVIRIESGEVRIVMLQQRAPVHPSTK